MIDAGRGLSLLVCLSLAACKPPAPAPPRYGAVMAEVGRRFELCGRAARSGRFELAEYQLGELEELVADLPRAEPPRESARVDLVPIARAFAVEAPPRLAGALKARDAAALAAAWREVAARCNACHQASGHRFIEVPDQPGQSVPRVD
jgi:hypothetical protein